MRVYPSFLAVGFALFGAVACTSQDSTSTVGQETSASSSEAGQQDLDLDNVLSRASCPGGKGHARCYAHVRVDSNDNLVRPQLAGVTPAASSVPSGLGADDLANAYQIPATQQAGNVVIVDAYDYPTAEADLQVYRAQYGLPECTTANGCFKRVNQNGDASPLPSVAPSSDDWTEEAALDLDMASAGCPSCRIILVETDADTFESLYAGVDTAAGVGGPHSVVSNSWGAPNESTDDASEEVHFQHDGVTMFVASGDTGSGASYPSSSPSIIAVGGTKLTKSTSAARGWTETVWGHGIFTKFLGGAGSGCSKYQAQPTWQQGVTTDCSKRAFSDISAVASVQINTYNTSNNNGGWYIIGGTSAASPLVAAIFAGTGHGGVTPAFPYQNPSAFFDITSGSNGLCIGKHAICHAGKGWDGPTGWGTPNATTLAATSN